MKKGGKKAARFFLKLVVVVLIIMVLLILVLSPLTKYLIRKYDVKYTGREIEVSHVFINPFTGKLSLRDFKMHEPDSDSLFISFHRFSVKLSILKLLTGTYQVSSLKLDQPVANITRTDTVFNFTDLIKRFTSKPVDTTKGPMHLNILNIKLSGGEITYSEPASITSLTISDIGFSSPGKYWDRDSVSGEFSLKPDTGYMNGNFTVNTRSKDYRFAAKAGNIALSSFNDFLKGFIRNPSMFATLFADLTASGNYGDPMNVNARGRLEINNFRIGSGKQENVAAFRKFLVKINEVDMKKSILHIDTILIDSPYVKYEKYDTLDNIRRMLTSRKKTPEKPDTVNLALKLMNSDYYINDLEVKNANLRFYDYSISQKFSIAFNPFSIKTDSVDSKNRRIKISINSKIEPYGSFSAFISMNPKNKKNMSGDYKLTNLPATMFNPYINTYTSYLLNRGKIQMNGNWSINNDNIQSMNHFLVLDPSDIKRSKGEDAKRVPLPIIMAFIRERGRIIEYEIPITGNLKNPKFHLSDVITDILRNIFVKPPTTPYRQQVQKVESVIDKTLSVEWKMRQAGLTTEQQKFLEGIAAFLKDNPDASIVVHPIYHESKEKEHILLFETKKKYFIEKNTKGGNKLSKDDSLKVENLSTLDKKFRLYLDSSIKKPLPLTLQAKCSRLIGEDLVNRRYELLQKERKDIFMKYFNESKTAARVDFLKEEDQFPFNWFSYFRIDYKGKVPESLQKAFDKLYQINSQPPREKYFNLFRRK